MLVLQCELLSDWGSRLQQPWLCAALCCILNNPCLSDPNWTPHQSLKTTFMFQTLCSILLVPNLWFQTYCFLFCACTGHLPLGQAQQAEATKEAVQDESWRECQVEEDTALVNCPHIVKWGKWPHITYVKWGKWPITYASSNLWCQALRNLSQSLRQYCQPQVFCHRHFVPDPL